MTPDQLARAENLLNPKEKEALAKLASDKFLSTQTAIQLFGLFLQGYSTDEIQRLNPNYGSIGLGLIVKARIEHDWDAMRAEYIADLMLTVRQTVEKSVLESIQFAADGLAVYRKLVGDRFKRYLQTGNPEDLGEFKEMSFKTYKDLIAIMQQLTSHNATPPPQQPTYVANEPEAVDAELVRVPQLAADRPVEAAEAAKMLEFLVKK
jgi:hypothetical protein